jgi:surface antigen
LGKNKSKYKYKGEYEVSPFGKMVTRATGVPFWPKGGPPPWAPAHGYRRKAGSAAAYASPYGIGSGRCNRSEIGAVLGDAAGLEAGKVTGKTAAAIRDVITGVLGVAGREFDNLDRACAGQVLEHGRTHYTVAWRNPGNRRGFEVTPTRTFRNDAGAFCREFSSVTVLGGNMRKEYGTACRRPDGSWRRIN